jgi:DNA-binding GntR family transcriptional regulator
LQSRLSSGLRKKGTILMEELSYKNLSNQPGQSLLQTQVYEYLR